MVDGPGHHGTAQSVSMHPGIEFAIARRCLDPIKALGFDKYFIVRGTEAHVGKSGGNDNAVGEWLHAEKDPDTGRASWWHLRMEIQGLRLSFAHHGKFGMLPWTKAAAINRYAFQVWSEYAEIDARSGGPPTWPHIAVRSHFHQLAMSDPTASPTQVISTPGWQFLNSFVHRIAADALADMGGVVLVIRDGKYTVHPYQARPARGATWRAA